MTNSNTPASIITATVTAYEGDAPGPRDWVGYVIERLQADYPGAEVDVEYGRVNESSSVGVDLDDDTFPAIIERYWDELCSDSGNEQWG